MIEHKMLHLFGGRMDAYGLDMPDGAGRAVRGPVNHELVKRHLNGDIGIGIYPMWQDSDGIWWVKWGCCDIDTGDWNEAYALATALRAMGLTPHVERSRSKGWHVWVFASDPVEAYVMRRALKVAYAAIDLPAKEANPKAEWLQSNQLGNYVRLPFKGGSLERQTMVLGWDYRQDGYFITATEWFAGFDDHMRVQPETLHHWAEKWHEPERKQFDSDRISEEEVDRLVGNMRGDLLLFVKNGPPRDRSGGLVALAFKLKAAGYEPQEVLGILRVADDRWGKYRDRPNRDEFLLDIVERTL